MNLIDLLKAKKQQEQNIEFAPLQPVQQEPTIQPVLLNQDGTEVENPVIMPENTSKIDAMKPRLNKARTTLADLLLGKQAPSTDVVNAGDMSATVSESPRRGGLLRDIAGGFNENLHNRMSFDNFGQNTLADGRKKGFAYRLGEGLGSATRFLDSPAGHMLLAYGASNMLGDTNPLEQAMTAGAVNINTRNNDRIYRNDLIQSAKQQLMNSPEFNTLTDAEQQQVMQNAKMTEGFDNLTEEQQKELISNAYNEYLTNKQQNALRGIENDYNGLRGYVTNDTYNNLMRSQQIRDNYAYRNMMLNNQLEQNKIMNQLRKDQFEATKAQQEFNRNMAIANLDEKRADRASRNAYQNAQLGLGYSKLALEQEKARNPKLSATERKAQEKERQSMNTINMINQAKNAVKGNPNAFKWTTGMLGADVANRLDPKGVKARSVVNSVTAEYRKYLTGAQMSDKERKDYEKFLPAPTDNARIIQDKLNGMLTVIGAREGINMGGGDPLGIR